MSKEQSSKNIQNEKSVFVKQMLELEVYPNLSQQVIMTTEDKLKLCLKENLKKAEKKNAWIAPTSILIAVITVFSTATFKEFILSAKTWEAFFILIGIASLVWLIISLRYAFYEVKIEAIIAELKNDQNSSKE